MKNKSDRLAFDRASVRRIDADGRLHVEITNISKATVNPYYGREIPNAGALGLEPNRLYQLLRDPEELAKAAPTFNNIQLLSIHIPVSADEPMKEVVVGSTGTDAAFHAPYLTNSLVIWDAVAIAGIDSDEQRELSSAYRYEADMTPGVFEGVAYDGVMRNIRGNHVALVERGRAGPDVLVADSLPLELQMRKKRMNLSLTATALKGALKAYLGPKIAQDARLGDLGALLRNVKAATLAKEQPKLVAAIKAHVNGKLAQDADLDDLAAVIDAFTEEDPDLTDGEVVLDDEGGGDDPSAKVLALLKGKLSDEDMAAVSALLAGKPAGAQDDVTDPPQPPNNGGQGVEPVDKPAMDAALKRVQDETVQRMNAIHQAQKDVAPYVGEVVAQDSAEAVYKMALDALNVDVTGVHPSAYRTILSLQKKPGEAPEVTPRLAADSAALSQFQKMCPTAIVPARG